MPMPIVIRTGFHDVFSGASLGSIHDLPSSDGKDENRH
jgi:hypothetical protein